jgi:hypothetical protein
MLQYYLIQLRGHWTADTLVALEESLGRAEIQEEVETHGDVVLVVSDVETDQLMRLIVLALPE